MDFVYPSYAYLWLAVPALIAVLLLVSRRARHAIKSWFRPSQYRLSWPFLKMALRLFAIASLLLALMGPYRSQGIKEIEQMAHEVYILLDISASMYTEDVKPSRLEKARRELKTLVRELKGDKVGLIVFADNPFVQCPLTHDIQATELFLNLADPAQFAEKGTAFRPALQLALERFISSPTPAKAGRVIVLVSDGEDHGGTFSSVLERLRRLDITVYSVGVGTYAGGLVPTYQDGEKVGMLTDENGMEVTSRLEDASLKDISASFNSPYIQLDAASKNLRSLAQEIRLLQPASLAVSKEQIANNQFQIFGLIGIICILLSLFIMPIKKS